MIGTSQINFASGPVLDPAISGIVERITKHILFSLAEACAPPSAIPFPLARGEGIVFGSVYLSLCLCLFVRTEHIVTAVEIRRTQ